MVVRIFIPSTQDTEVGGSQSVEGYSSLHSESQDIQSYIVRPFITKNKTTKNDKHILVLRAI